MVMEVIEDLTPCCDVDVSVRVAGMVSKVTREPQGVGVPFRVVGDRIAFTLDRFACHQMVALENGKTG